MTGRNSNQNGNAMIAVIIGLVILSGTCIELMTGGVSQIPNLIKSYRATATRDSLELSLMNRASFPGIYRSSLHPDVVGGGENDELLVCVVGVPGKLCMANTVYPIALYSWETDPKTLTSSLVKIAGPSPNLVALAQHVAYDVKGNICPAAGASSDCAFLNVESSFKATCPAGAGSCAVADNFIISYSISGSSAEKNSMATKDRVAAVVNINDILPPKVGTAPTLTQITGKIGSSAPTTDLSATIALIKAAGETFDPTISNLANLLVSMGVTDPTMITAIAKSRWRDQASIKGFIDTLSQLSITNPIIIIALANQYDQGVWFRDVANAITAAGITDQEIANQLSRFSIKDPVLAAAYAIPKSPAILNLITSSANWLDPGYVNALASALYVAGITTAPQGSILAVARSGILDPTTISGVLSAIAASGSTNQAYIDALAANRITDPAVAIQAINTLNATGAANSQIAAAILAGRMFDVAIAQNFNTVMGAAGGAVNPYAYVNNGLTSLPAFNNFVSATVAAHVGYDEHYLRYLAGLAVANNLTTIADMQALVSGAYNPPTVAQAPTVAVVAPVLATPTVSPPAVQGTPSNLANISALNTLSGTCTVDCLGSAF